MDRGTTIGAALRFVDSGLWGGRATQSISGRCGVVRAPPYCRRDDAGVGSQSSARAARSAISTCSISSAVAYAHLLGHAALERALDQRRDGPPDTAARVAGATPGPLPRRPAGTEQGRGVVDRVGGNDQPEAGLRTGGDGVVGPDLPTLHRARVSDTGSAQLGEGRLAVFEAGHQLGFVRPVVAGERGGGVPYGELTESGGGGAGQVAATHAASTQVGGRRRVDVDLKPLTGSLMMARVRQQSVRVLCSVLLDDPLRVDQRERGRRYSGLWSAGGGENAGGRAAGG